MADARGSRDLAQGHLGEPGGSRRCGFRWLFSSWRRGTVLSHPVGTPYQVVPADPAPSVSTPISSERVETPIFSNSRASVFRTVLVEMPSV
jgi:hypothetical protein